MADEKPAAPAVDEAAKAEAAYNERLASLISGASDDTDSPLVPKSDTPEEKPKKEEGEPEEKEEEEDKEGEGEPAADEEADKEEADGEKAPEGKEKYSQAFRKLQQKEAEVQQFKNQVLQRERELQHREQKLAQGESEVVQFIKDLNTDTFETLLRYGLIDQEKADYMARQLYLRSAAAANDPKARLEADRLKAHEKLREGQREVERQLKLLQEQRELERQKQADDYQLNQYVARFEATIEGNKVKRPLLARALEKLPNETREELFRIASQLAEAKDEYPDPTLVILAWEKRIKTTLAAHEALKEQPASTTNPVKSKPADEKKGPSNGKSNGSSTKAAVTDEEKEAAYQKELRARLNGTWTGAD